MKGLPLRVLVGLALGLLPAAPAQAELPLRAAFISAGGGVAAFKTVTLLGFLAGGDPGVALARLTAADGAPSVKRSIDILDFCVRDAQRLQALPAGAFDPLAGGSADAGEQLSRALYAAGIPRPHAAFETRTLVNRLLPHGVARTLMTDATARFGAPAVATFEHAVARELAAVIAGYARE